MSATPKDLEPVVATELGDATKSTETAKPTETIAENENTSTAIAAPEQSESKPEAVLENTPPTPSAQPTAAPTPAGNIPSPLPSASPVPNTHDSELAAAVAAEATSTISPLPTNNPQELHEDDGYGSDEQSVAASASLASSIRDYGFENGRRYHKFREGNYVFPNDEPEQDREDMKHAMCVNLCGGKLHFAPIDRTKSLNILDVGTGTGIWCIDMGDEYPSASILGIDLSPIQPAFVPPNVRFMVDDAESSWLVGPDHYDYVHFRHMSPAIKDFPRTLRRAYTSLKSGGWIELQDLTPEVFCDDGTMPDDYAVGAWLKLFAEGLLRLGPDVLSPKTNISRLTAAGFTNIQQAVYKCPIGPWARNSILRMVGLYERSALYDGAEALSLGGLVRGLGWSVEEMQVYLVEVRRALMDSGVHSYIYYYNTWGQKPF